MLSYGLVLALFLLAPGFAAYAGIFAGLQSGKFQASPPPANSIFSLGVVGVSALVVHAAWALVLAGQDAICAAAPCFRTPFEPDVYTAALAAVGPAHPTTPPGEVAAFLLTCVGLTGASYALSRLLARSPAVAEHFRGSVYGLYAGLVEEAPSLASSRPAASERYVMTYVVTDMQKDGAYVGYFGILENLQVGPDKQILGIALLDCNIFLLQIGRTVRRTPDLRSQSLPRLILGGAHIQNVVFTVIEWD